MTVNRIIIDRRDSGSFEEFEVKFDESLMNKAAARIENLFGGAAVEALGAYTDTKSVGWIDEPDEVFRAHTKKPSAVLGSPYFEDIECRLKLVGVDGRRIARGWGAGMSVPYSPVLFRLESQIVVAVTLNPASAYRQPTLQEEAPYGEVLVRLVDQVRKSIAKQMGADGWITRTGDTEGTIVVTGFAQPRWTDDGKGLKWTPSAGPREAVC